MELNNRDFVSRSLEVAIEGLQPFVVEVLAPLLPAGLSWTDLLEERDRSNGVRNKTYLANDLQGLLRVLTERLGNLGYPFGDRMPRIAQNLASELRGVRNNWAHHADFSDEDTYRALDTTERLLRAVGATAAGDEAAKLRLEFRPSAIAEPSTPTLPEAHVATSDSENAQSALSIGRATSDEVPAPTQVSLQLDVIPVLSYAAAHNRLAVVNSVTIVNDGPAQRGAVMRLEARSALGLLSIPFERMVDLAASSSVTLTDLPMLLDAEQMLQVEERRPAEVTATLQFERETRASGRADVELLAAHQWVRQPANLSIELLAAFVLPNHPSISVLLSEASELLLQSTGSGSLQGYQDGETRVDQIAQSIYEAMQARKIRYSNPPASWGDDGQKIRTPEEVLDGRVGTCLDTTVVMAAAFEQAGLRPLLWLVDGHAFVGYWRIAGSLGYAASTDVMDALNQVDLDRMGVIETTALTEQAEPITFAAASRSPRIQHLVGRPQHILGITDVIEARLARIFPLPARTTAADGTVTVTRYSPTTNGTIEYEDFDKTVVDGSPAEPVPYRVNQWKNSLLDLTLRNRLINFTDSSRISLAVPAGDVSYLEDMINLDKDVTMLPSDEVAEVVRARGLRYGRDLPEPERTALVRDKHQVYADVTEAAYTTRFRSLAYKAKTIEQETGANNLYMAFGTLIWQIDNRELRSPLVLVPVKLELGRGGRYKLVHDESASSTPNYCLLEKLRKSFGLAIPGLAEPEADGAGIDLDAAFRATRQALEEGGHPFRVEPTVDLAILQFAKFRLWKDLDDNWQELASNPLVSHLINTPTQPFIDPNADSVLADLDELGALSPVAADSSQLAAVAAAVGGRTFVLEGPPGTGKSQTITNLLVRAVAEGKKVLFVAEKRAALNVVQRRLEEVGLGPFALDLHDKGSRPVAVRAQIKAALQHRVSSDVDGLRAATETLGSARRTLSRYAQRLHETNGAGLSYYSARNRFLSSDPTTPTMEVPSAVVTGDQSAVESLRRLFRQLPDAADPARPRAAHPWGFIDTVAELDQASVSDACELIDSILDNLRSNVHAAKLLDAMPSVAFLQSMGGLARAPRYSLQEVDAASTERWKRAVAAAQASLISFLGTAGTFHDVRPEILGLPLDEINAASVAADGSQFFGRKKRRLAVRSRLEPYVAANVLPKPKLLSAFTSQLSSLQTQVESLRHEFSEIEGMHQDSSWNPLAEKDAVTRISDRATGISWLAEVLARRAETQHEFVDVEREFYEVSSQSIELADEFAALSEAFAELQDGLGSSARNQLSSWASAADLVTRWDQTRAGREPGNSGRTSLGRWVELVAYLEPLFDAGLLEARKNLLSGVLPSEAATASFDKGIAATSLIERAQSTTLDAFDSEIHELAVTRFNNSSEDVRASLIKEIPSQLVKSRTFNSMGAVGQIGELTRQLDKPRGMGVRKLLDSFGPLISELVPCMLMSPESVARFFPVKRDIFDIVVFDEASQIRVADAIGSMGRAASVVIVGDSKQMPPSSFAESSMIADDADRDAAILVQDEESILSECVSAQVTPLALTWHYRSQDESLISFSNEHYYGNLSSFPSPLHGSSDDGINGHGISLVRVNGKFLRSATGKQLRTNPVEAEAIVEEIKQRFWHSPETFPSLGVVTFNAQQRALIETLLRDANDPRIVEALDSGADGLFVKNLENVQGDERDTILFSTAFSANEKGVLPLQFGPIGQAGGERRLNVAITRARRQIVMFSSFDPQELRSEDTTSVGLKHLRAYLELASGSRPFASMRAFRDELVDRHCEEIAGALRERGITVTTDVGLSDFRIDLSLASATNPNQPLVAVLLDNLAWAERKTVADRDGLPTTVLLNLMRWPAVSRVWSPDWIANRDDVLNRLVALVAEAEENVALSVLEAPLNAASDSDNEVKIAVTPPSAQVTGTGLDGANDPNRHWSFASAPTAATQLSPSGAPTLSGSTSFEQWKVRQLGSVYTLDRLPARDATREIEGVIREIVVTEGPIHVVRLCKLVANSYGLDRVAQSRVASILRCLPPELLVGRDKTYAWPVGESPETSRGFRRSEHGADRNLEHVHPAEIINAMCAISQSAMGLYEDELRRETLKFFGLSRMTTKLTEILDAALRQALEAKRLERSDTGVIVSTV
jgi:hypothetical protein